MLLSVISNLAYSQEFNVIEDSLINKTIHKYSKHRMLMNHSFYTIANIDNYETDDYWVVSYLPEMNNKFTPQRDEVDTNKLELVYQKVRLIGNHPVFWSTIPDSSNYDFLIETMTKYNLIDSFYVDFDENKIYDENSYPKYVLDDGAIVVYFIVRRKDWKIIRKFRTRRYGRIYDYMDKFK